MKPTDGPAEPPPPSSTSDPALTPTVAGESAAYEATVGAGPSSPEASDRSSFPSYSLGAVIGRGGMGEVVLARDERIGRDVAIKRMRGAAPNPDAVTRFLREARIPMLAREPIVAECAHGQLVPTGPDSRSRAHLLRDLTSNQRWGRSS